MTKAFLQVVGSGSPDLPPSLYIFTDKRRYGAKNLCCRWVEKGEVMRFTPLHPGF